MTQTISRDEVRSGLAELGYTDVRKYVEGIEDWAGSVHPPKAARPAAPDRG